MQQNNRTAFAIDLGTAYIYSAISEAPSSATVLPHGDGEHNYYSYIAFWEGQVMTGLPAKGMSSKHSESVIYNFKHLIGHTAKEPSFLQTVKRMPFPVDISGSSPKVKVCPTFNKSEFTAEELLAVLFGVMKQSAQRTTQGPVTNVVLTVPCNYNTKQREAIMTAASIAGLETVRLVSQSTAALLFDRLTNPNVNGHLLLVKMGAGSLEVVVATAEAETLSVLGYAYDQCAGGDNFDLLLVQQCIEHFLKQKGLNISGNIRACKRLKNQCEKARMALTTTHEAYVQIDSLAQGEDFCIKFSRAQFETFSERLITRVADVIGRAVAKSGLSAQQLNHIVLSGAACKMPCVLRLLKQVAPHLDPQMPAHPEQLAVQGAAIYGHSLRFPQTSNMLLMDITTNTFWLTVDSFQPIMLVSEGELLPLVKTHSLQTVQNTQIVVSVFEGDKSAPQTACQVGSHSFLATSSGTIELQLTVDLNNMYKLAARQAQSMRILADLKTLTTPQVANLQEEVLKLSSSLDDID